jgi:hypothetical protein
VVLAGPALEASFESWSGETFIETGSRNGYNREHFHLELRRPVRDWLVLIGGTRIDRVDTKDFSFDGDSLFAGLRAQLQRDSGALYFIGRILRGMTDDRTGSSVEAGVLLRLPGRISLPMRSRRGRFELIISGERDDLGDDRLDRETRAALRLRYAISR